MPDINNHKRIVLAAASSGSGKTTITCALLEALKSRGIKVRAFKTGPDYIDPMFHRKVIGIPSKNLDLFFTDEETTRTVFLDDNDSDISVIEGVMGLYDGIGGTTEQASTYHLARTLDAPIILIVNARGMGRSVISLIRGFLMDDDSRLIKGVILNQISAGYYETIAPIIEKELDIKVFGYMPALKDIHLDSRHLGLKLPEEIDELGDMVKLAARTLEGATDLTALLKIAEECQPVKARNTSLCQLLQDRNITVLPKVKIGVAYDEAFCFYYEDNIKLLRLLGADITYFSPVHDKALPEDLDGIVLGGGYPELKARELSENTLMLDRIRKAWKEGIPFLAECGGFMYLHKTITDGDGEKYPFCGLVDGDIFYNGRLVRFGYISLNDRAEENINKTFLSGGKVKGHEFHYYDSTSNGNSCQAVKPVSMKKWECIHADEQIFAGFPHLYYLSNIDFAVNFIERCRKKNGELV